MLDIGVYKATTYHASGPHPVAQIGEGFATQYYTTLCIYPPNTCKFYKEDSFMSRQKNHGICSITTMEEIENELLNSDMRDAAVVLLTIHSQNTIADSILVCVTGLLRKDDMSKCFHQNFLLAPQAKSFYVKNDFLRFIDMPDTPIEINDVSIKENGISREKDVDVSQASATVAPATTESSTSTRILKTIMVKDLPPDVTRKSIARALKEFGPVKYKNIQIRAYEDDYTYAFVEFNNLGATNQAVQAGSVIIEGRECLVEHKEGRIAEL